jgi:hypothetical protein
MADEYNHDAMMQSRFEAEFVIDKGSTHHGGKLIEEGHDLLLGPASLVPLCSVTLLLLLFPMLFLLCQNVNPFKPVASRCNVRKVPLSLGNVARKGFTVGGHCRKTIAKFCDFCILDLEDLCIDEDESDCATIQSTAERGCISGATGQSRIIDYHTVPNVLSVKGKGPTKLL